MRTKKNAVLGLVMAGAVFFASCAGSSTDKAGEKTTDSKSTTTTETPKASDDKSWTQPQREEFMTNCMSSAKASYEKRGQTADVDMIKTICQCTGQEIESKYGYDESSKIPAEEMKAFVIAATQKCATASAK